MRTSDGRSRSSMTNEILLLYSVLNDAFGIVTGCLCPNQTDHLPIHSGIQSDELRRLGATLSLAPEQTADHVLTSCPIHQALHRAQSLKVLNNETRYWLNIIVASV